MPVSLIPDRDIPPKEAKALVGKRETADELKPEAIEKLTKALRRDVGDPVEAFIADSWTLEFDLALRPGLAADVHQAIQLARSSSRKPGLLAKIRKRAAEEYSGWVTAGKSATEIAVLIYQPLLEKGASKAEVAEQLAAILRARPEDPAAMRELLPPYLIRAVDYVTGGYVPGAPPFTREADEGEGDDDGVGGAGGDEVGTAA